MCIDIYIDIHICAYIYIDIYIYVYTNGEARIVNHSSDDILYIYI